MDLPEQGIDRDEVMQELEELRRDDVPWLEGKAFTNLFIVDRDGKRLVEDAFRSYLWENALDPTQFPSLLRLETDILAMAAAHLGGDESITGSFTSGGTESVMLAVKSARDLALATRPELARLGKPEIVLPVTAHPCFQKAAHYLGLDATQVPVDPETLRADPAAMAAAITDRTILLVGSAPSYAHGVVDPIPELGALAEETGIPLHVDGCIGGWLLPFFRELGAPVPAFGFEVPGVGSISMDLHKYAFAAKGASVVLYRDPARHRHQVFTWSSWPGYSLVNPVIQSSRSGGPLAAAWAILKHYGHDGYLEVVRNLKASTDQIVETVNASSHLRVLSRPEMCLVAIASTTDDLCIFDLADALRAKGWVAYPQFRMGEGMPPSLHLTILPKNLPHVDRWLADLEECVAELLASPPERSPGLAAMAASVDLSACSDVELQGLLAQVLGDGGPSAPSPDVNRLLDALPTAIRDRVLGAAWQHIIASAGRPIAAVS